MILITKTNVNMRKIASLLMMLLCFCALAFGQTRTVTGQVRDEKGDPIPFATIVEAGNTNNGTKADAAGNFSLKVKDGAQLTISAAGYDPVTTAAGAATYSLKTRTTEMQEVVVTTALGIQRQSKEIGYSTAKVKASELTAARPTNLQNGLTGKVSGLNVTTVNSGVFADTRITLRGIRSLTGNNQPMLILDGVPLSLGYLSSINPNDVADVTILKSASATGIYGPDGANGAIVITTKRGSKAKPAVTFSHSTQIESISYMPDFQKQFGSGYSADADGYGIYDPVEQQSWGDAFDGSIRQLGEEGPNGEAAQQVKYAYFKNGRRNFWDNGITNQTDVSFSTGDFYLSGQNALIRGSVPGDENNRRAITLRAEKEYGRFKATFNVRYTQNQWDVTTNNTLIYYTVTGAPGQIDISKYKRWKTDWFASPDGYYTTFMDNNGKTPYFAKDNYRQKGRTDDLFGNIELNFKATSWLRFTYRVGVTVTDANSQNTRGAFRHAAWTANRQYPQTTNVTAAVTDASTFSSRLTTEALAIMEKKVKKFGFSAILGHSYRQSQSKALSINSDNLGFTDLVTIISRKGEANVGVGNSKTRLERFFGQVGVDYDGWAFVTATGSYDRDSRLAPPAADFKVSDLSFFYPGVNASVLLSQVIPGLKSSNIVSYLKIRGAINKTGNVNAGAYAFETLFGLGTFFPFGSVSGYQIGGTQAPSTLKPEFINNKEVGIEIGLLKNRINFEATYYNQNNTDQIINVALSGTTGFNGSTLNAASFINKGFELDLRLTPLIKFGKGTIDFKVNYTYNTSEVTDIYGDQLKELGVGNFNYAIVGQPAYVFKLTDYVRDDQGRVIVDAATGMPELNPNLTQFGRTAPTDILGLNLNVNWKNLSFSATAEYRGGNQMVADQLGSFLDDNGVSARSAYNGRRPFVWPNSSYYDGSKYVDNVDIYTTSFGRPFWNSTLNTGAITNYLASAAFWKLREVAINYQINGNKLFKGNVVKNIVIGVSGRNLLMFVPKSNQWTDPEFSNTLGNAQSRSTAANMPPTRFYGANVVFTF
jgi:TonB-linked SusC/RagA family outer membrane protein